MLDAVRINIVLLNQLFAMLLEVILRKNRSIFNHRNLLLNFLEGNVIIYHVIAYDPKSEKNVRKMATNFCNLRSFLENIQRLFGNFSLILITKNEPLLINTS